MCFVDVCMRCLWMCNDFRHARVTVDAFLSVSNLQVLHRENVLSVCRNIFITLQFSLLLYFFVFFFIENVLT